MGALGSAGQGTMEQVFRSRGIGNYMKFCSVTA